MVYNHKDIEQKWQKIWREQKTFKTENNFDKPGYYCLDMFPYPSGAGLHVGHPKGFVGNDVYARYKHACGYNVLHPMGWDAFGLPAENYAIKTGIHPRIKTQENIENYKRQMSILGFSYDWDREINTTDPKYYKRTQWIFLKLFENGLAYEQDLPINYCPSCKTGLANEEVLNDFTCERCGSKVEKKKLRQRVLAITKYADRLANDVDDLDRPEGIKQMQKNWIGRSEGCEFDMHKSYTYEISVVTDSEFKEILDIKNKDKANTYKFKKEDFFAARDDGKMIAFGRVHKDESGNVEFGGLYVDEKYRGNKLGYEIVHYILTSQNIDTIYLDADKELQKYYENCGFQKLTQPKDFQIKKNKEIYEHYNIPFSESELIKKKVFMKLKKNNFIFPKISVYTTRIDTVFGMTYAVIAPDHPKVGEFITNEQKKVCKEYIENAAKKSDQDRTQDDKEKTGVFTGSYVINSFNNEKVPLWIGDYVLGSYGTGAVMAVPAHDERDFAFAQKYNLDILYTIFPQEIIEKFEKQINEEYVNSLSEEELDKLISETNELELDLYENGAYTPDGFIGEIPIGISKNFQSDVEKSLQLNKEFFGMSSEDARKKLIKFAEENGFGIKKINYKLRDWLFSRQRYWGEPIPLIHFKNTDLDKIIKLNFYVDSVVNNIKNGKKTLETRALNTEEGERYFGKIQEGDIIIFDYKTTDEQFLVKVKKTKIWQNLEELYNDKENYKKLSFDLDNSKTLKEFKESYNYTEDYLKKIETNGIIGFDFEIISKIYDGINGKIICDYNLPLELPDVERYEPAGDGNSPLKNIEKFVNIKLGNNLYGERETNTMPQWGGSCWYYLRFMDPHNDEALIGKDVEKYRGNVNNYVGGAEHAVLHLLYARFWHKFLYDINILSTHEPFQKLVNQGMIQAFAFKKKNGGLIANDLVEEKNGKFFHKETGEELDKVVSKMSKSLKNVVNPDDIIEEYGADTFRIYEMYMSEFRDSAPWDTKGIIGVRRFLDRLYKIFENSDDIKNTENDNHAMKLLHKTIKKAQEDIENYKFNTTIAQFMILVNYGLPSDEQKAIERKENLLKILHPFAPHISEELWKKMGNKNSIFFESWPKFDEKLIIDDEIEIAVQVMGKLRGTIVISQNEDKSSVINKSKQDKNVAKFLEGKNIVKEIYIPNKIVNLVVK